MKEYTYTVVGSVTSKGGVREDVAIKMFDDIVSVFGDKVQEQKNQFLKDGIVRFDKIQVDLDGVYEDEDSPSKLTQFVNDYADTIGDLQFTAQGDATSDLWYYKLYPDNSLMASKATISFDNWQKVN